MLRSSDGHRHADSKAPVRNSMNSWSHATYVSIAAGALVDEINSIVARGETPDEELIARTEALFDRLPALCTEKRTLGEKPVTETFIVRRLEAQRAKLQRWINAGRLPPDAKLWQAIRITNSMGECDSRLELVLKGR